MILACEVLFKYSQVVFDIAFSAALFDVAHTLTMSCDYWAEIVQNIVQYHDFVLMVGNVQVPLQGIS
jgi:hypothetical protein